ncbi:hypothetical protein JDN40_07035 [Rhodomicrobium vannielii ATCC 17100]|uniref:hypothetical protein n=1 Tax=Rhodomicrobium vannielii TaxID=1069 RepID=UPI00191B3873|nr:hypothetical protein [Rhodomicrobium vannielii]MBJ7533854.1 hypothetical protein [Rhodomicrobium vannielii ATCC 17100]
MDAVKKKLLETIQTLVAKSAVAPPVVELDDYFEGNTREDSIAPNQVGWGRPGLAELFASLKTIRARPDVQAVLVGIHGDWVEALDAEESWPAAENVFIYTSARMSDVEKWIAGFKADGVIKGWPYGKHPAAPEPQNGYAVYAICWD